MHLRRSENGHSYLIMFANFQNFITFLPSHTHSLPRIASFGVCVLESVCVWLYLVHLFHSFLAQTQNTHALPPQIITFYIHFDILYKFRFFLYHHLFLYLLHSELMRVASVFVVYTVMRFVFIWFHNYFDESSAVEVLWQCLIRLILFDIYIYILSRAIFP